MFFTLETTTPLGGEEIYMCVCVCVCVCARATMSTKVVSVVGKKETHSFLEFLFLSFSLLIFLPVVLDCQHSHKKNCTLGSVVAEGK